jgi:hypothetical protein
MTDNGSPLTMRSALRVVVPRCLAPAALALVVFGAVAWPATGMQAAQIVFGRVPLADRLAIFFQVVAFLQFIIAGSLVLIRLTWRRVWLTALWALIAWMIVSYTNPTLWVSAVLDASVLLCLMSVARGWDRPD